MVYHVQYSIFQPPSILTLFLLPSLLPFTHYQTYLHESVADSTLVSVSEWPKCRIEIDKYNDASCLNKNYNTEYIVYNKLDLWFKTIPEMELV